MKKTLLLACVSFLALGPCSVSATTLDFIFTGHQETDGFSAVGYGTLSFADGLTTVDLGDLTNFSYIETIEEPPNSGHPVATFDTNAYTLANVSTFSMTLSSGYPISLELTTTGELRFRTFGTETGDALFAAIDSPALQGGITFTPEPSSWALFLSAGLLTPFVQTRLRHGSK